MSNALMVPIHLDALYLEQDLPVVEAMADFSRLPYFNGERDVNPDVANISEEILSQPFQDCNLYLKAGIHLHWALPDALTKGYSQKNGVIFPAVPNRWLVTRHSQNGEKQWIVESDYLHPIGEGTAQGGISYPYQPKSNSQPFRYMGRQLPRKAWTNRDNGEYLDKLTAVGYGEPTFAAFYPNCHSVFGFYDSEVVNNQMRYDVIGWYSMPEQNDCLNQNDLTYQILEEEYNWVVKDKLPPFPNRTIYYARLKIESDEFTDNRNDQQPVKIALGNTGTEALSAYLANAIDPDNSLILEDQLEALHLAPRLEGRVLDTGFKFKEARHEKEFAGVPAGTIWIFHPETATPTQADATEVPLPTQETLPEELAHLLNQLNQLQQAYDQARHEIESMRRQLFADWYKYMLCAYPPEDARDDYPDIDEVKYFIEKNGLEALKQKVAKTGVLLLARDKDTGVVTSAKEFNDDPNTLAFQLAEAIKGMYKAVADLQLLTEGDIKDEDLKDFSDKLTSSATRLDLSLLQIQPSVLRASAPESQDTKKQIVETLNEFIKTEPGSQAKPTSFQFPGELQSLSFQLPKQKKVDWPYHRVLRFNRLQLQAAFSEIEKSVPYALRAIPAPRYWRPNDPVVLLTDVQPTPRHGEDGRLHLDGLLECHVLNLDEPIPDQFDTIRATVNELESQEKELIGFYTWSRQPWHPFLLEWEVELFPIKDKNNLDPNNRTYDSDFITGNYQLAENAADLALQPGQVAIEKAANIYSGRSILTPYANIQLKRRLEAYLEKQADIGSFYDEKNIGPEEQDIEHLPQHIDDLETWYKDKNSESLNTPEAKAQDPVYTAIRAYKQLATSSFLTQALDGFDEALLMHKRTLQLPIADPLGFEDYQHFTQVVAEKVGRSNRSAPQPLNDFNPIRSGAMKLLKLRLVDTFGRVQELNCNQVITTDVMPIASQDQFISLPPRLAQPARLNFRWLSANHGANQDEDELEMNAHPATSPICGWLVPNNLDNSLMIYDQRGQALGSVYQNAQWIPAPGGERPVGAKEIPNPHLNKLINHLIQQGQDFLPNFLTAIESALENIDPENFAHHQALALLMGRPIAVVRACLNLELMGRPAINQDWNVFRQDMQRRETETDAQGIQHRVRETDNFTQVEFPIRLGEYCRLNDGLVGYWREADEGYEDNLFYAPQSNLINDAHIKSHADDPMTIRQTVAKQPQTLTMLVDPRGAVHATCGILPTKAITIPADQYVEALQAIEVTFLSAPILTQQGKINLPLPTEPGYAWSWLAKENGVWADTSTINPADMQATFAGRQEILGGWLKLSRAEEKQPATNQPEQADE